jgi:nucleotide-binding universal stress UspA family protein
MGVVVVGVDLSPTSTRALREALVEAQWRECSVEVLYVLTMPAIAAVEFGAMSVDLDQIRRAGEKALDEHIAELEATYDGGFPVDVVSRVVIGHTGTQILETAENTKAELVVLGSRGLGGFRGLMVGSVTTYAIHHLRTRLLVVPAEESDWEER